ncbi:hypothetical protein [Fodinicola feengrottensis]|uniref:hypothetical protein n=1 Tax=Fodinicola feengrottensis TaxID=435914 RepID=UPI00244111E0|nr:hypothetical protein [Fodinicola feengrottensis]
MHASGSGLSVVVALSAVCTRNVRPGCPERLSGSGSMLLTRRLSIGCCRTVAWT